MSPSDTWIESYAIWSSSLDLPPTHERVARAVVQEKITQSLSKLHDREVLG